MDATSIQDNVNWLLLRASFVAKHRLIKISEEHDLAPMQALTLCLLEPGETVAMSNISGLLSCDPSNVTGIVERLTVGKLIERRESTVDRRVKTIGLTDSGTALRAELLSRIGDHNATNLDSLTADELECLTLTLQKILPTPDTSKQYN